MSIEGPDAEPKPKNAYVGLVEKTADQHRLFSVHWELTYRCNQRCSHCYLNVSAPNAPVDSELTTSECLRVADDLAALGVMNVTLSGGEILVRRDLFQIAEHLRSNRFLLRLFTNGILITPQVADRIAALHPYAVEISVYSTDAAVHDRITGLPRSFELTMRGFQLLSERGVRSVMKTPLMHENVLEIHALEQLAKDLGATFRFDTTITTKDDGGLSPLAHRMTDEDLRWLFNEMIDPSLWVDRKIKPEQRVCNIARNALVIDPCGNIQPCVQIRRTLGNIKNQSIQTIWDDSDAWSELGQITYRRLNVCSTCELQSLCVRCHGLAALEDEDMLGPSSVNCREALARRAVLVEKGLLPADFPIPAHLNPSGLEHDRDTTIAPFSISDERSSQHRVLVRP